MKKIIIFLFPFLLSGCFFGEVGKGNLTTVCTKETTTGTFIVSNKNTISFKNNQVQEVEIIEKYTSSSKEDKNTLQSIKETMTARNKNLKNVEGIEINILTEEEQVYEVKYKIILQKLPEEYLKEFNLYRDYTKQVTNLKESGMTCK